MADDHDSPDDEREVEVSAVKAIFPELLTDTSTPFWASLDIAVAPLRPFPVVFHSFVGGVPSSIGRRLSVVKENLADNYAAAEEEPQIRQLSFLPPLKLSVALPKGYPAKEPPQIDLQSSWLPKQKIQELKEHALIAWEEVGRDQVLYDYIDYLQQAAEDGFGLSSQGRSTLNLPPDLEVVLLDYDFGQKRAKFEQETFECAVCLEPKKGKVCHRLALCGHVFCIACLQDFYNNCITEGDVANVKCLAPDCARGSKPTVTKKRQRYVDRNITPSELLQIPLEHEMVQRYIKMKRKKELESDKSTIYCPRKWCQGAARSTKKAETENAVADDDSDKENESAEEKDDEREEANKVHVKLPPLSERLSICSDCSFAFCSVCRQCWHGELISCMPPRKEGELTEEERLSDLYLAMHSTPCPTCDARCQKSHGCNHMICFNCGTHFCYLCSAWLGQANPYEHFNTEGAPCYQRLWELEDGDDDRGQRGALGIQPQERAQQVLVDELVLQEASDDEPELDRAAVAGVLPPPAPAPPAPPAGADGPPWANGGGRVNGRAARGLVRRPALPNPADPQNGLQRFLAMAQNDEEDGWDSDELDGEEDEEWGNFA